MPMIQDFATIQKFRNSSAGPIQFKRFQDAWNKLNWEHNTHVQKGGVIGVSEYSTVQFVLCGDTKREDVTAAQLAIGERFGWTITAENARSATSAVLEAMPGIVAGRPVHDDRKHPDTDAAEKAESNRKTQEQEEKRKAERAAFASHYGNGQTVTVQPGEMAVVASLRFDDSDSMSDYFDRHAQLSQDFALLVVPKGAQTEKIARRGAAVSPVLSGVEFAWHTENYSMGHGNYLESGGFELPADLHGVRQHLGTPVTRAHWEITFRRAYSSPITIEAAAGFGQTPTGGEPGPVRSSSGLTITENDEKDGIEIRFPSKPDAAVLESLKAAGWRWSRFSSCWYTKRTDRARQFAAALQGAEPEAKAELEAIPHPPDQARTPAAAFRAKADALEPKIADKSRPMTQNPTPKRNCQFQVRMHEARNMERTQRALRALADGHDAGTLPPDLAALRTVAEIAELVHKSIDHSRGGYYSVIECLDYADKSPRARALQAMIEGNPEEHRERERSRKRGELMAEIALSNFPGYFPTQEPEARRAVEMADIRPGMRVLEPSAGTGALVYAIFADVSPVFVMAIERMHKLFEALNLGFTEDHSVMESRCADFLELTPRDIGTFNRIVMNPPFENRGDIIHIQHAMQFLKPGGRLVAICANGPRQNQELRPMVEGYGGTWEELPAGAFKAAGTNISTVLLSFTL